MLVPYAFLKFSTTLRLFNQLCCIIYALMHGYSLRQNRKIFAFGLIFRYQSCFCSPFNRSTSWISSSISQMAATTLSFVLKVAHNMALYYMASIIVQRTSQSRVNGETRWLKSFIFVFSLCDKSIVTKSQEGSFRHWCPMKIFYLAHTKRNY